jgi:hypothetical protein
MSNVTDLKLSAIRTDGGTQPRVELNQEVIDEYAKVMRAGAIFPPVTVFYDGTFYWLADGFHRFEAAKRTGASSITADLKQGTQREAVLHSVGVNATHGLRRTSADKRRAVEILLQDPEWKNWSDSAIAKTCQVDNKTVARIRSDLGIPKSTSRKSANGRIINVANIGKRTKHSTFPSQSSTPESATQSESKESSSANQVREEQPDLAESSLAAAKSYTPGDRIRILRRQDGQDKWSGKTALIREITPDDRLRVDVEGAKGVRFTLNPEWVESMSEASDNYKVQPEQVSPPQLADEPDPKSPAIADAAAEELPANQPILQLQAGDRLRLANLEQSGQQWVGEVDKVVQVGDDEIEVLVKIRSSR